MLYADAQRLARSADIDDALERFAADVELAVAELARGWVFVHSAVVGFADAAVLLPGPSGSGKSTLTLALLRAGATCYSDEFAVLDPRGRVHPFVRASTGPHRVTVPRKPLPVGLVVATTYRAGASWTPRTLSRAEALLALLANAVAVRREPARVIAVLERATSRSRALEGARGEADDTARFILDHLARWSRP